MEEKETVDCSQSLGVIGRRKETADQNDASADDVLEFLD